MHMDNEAGGERAEDVARRLERHPIVKAAIMKLPDLIEDAGGDLRRADDAERRAIDESERWVKNCCTAGGDDWRTKRRGAWPRTPPWCDR